MRKRHIVVIINCILILFNVQLQADIIDVTSGNIYIADSSGSENSWRTKFPQDNANLAVTINNGQINVRGTYQEHIGYNMFVYVGSFNIDNAILDISDEGTTNPDAEADKSIHTSLNMDKSSLYLTTNQILDRNKEYKILSLGGNADGSAYITCKDCSSKVKVDIVKWSLVGEDGGDVKSDADGHITGGVKLIYNTDIKYRKYFDQYVPDKDSQFLLDTLDNGSYDNFSQEYKGIIDILDSSKPEDLSFNADTLKPVNLATLSDSTFKTVDKAADNLRNITSDKMYLEEMNKDGVSEFWMNIFSDTSFSDKSSDLRYKTQTSSLQLGYLFAFPIDEFNSSKSRVFFNITAGTLLGGSNNESAEININGAYLGGRLDYYSNLFANIFSNLGVYGMASMSAYDSDREMLNHDMQSATFNGTYVMMGADWATSISWYPEKVKFRVADVLLDTDYADRVDLKVHNVRFGLFAEAGNYSTSPYTEVGSISYDVDSFNDTVIDTGLFMRYNIADKNKFHRANYGMEGKLHLLNHSNTQFKATLNEMINSFNAEHNFTFNNVSGVGLDLSVFCSYYINKFEFGANASYDVLDESNTLSIFVRKTF